MARYTPHHVDISVRQSSGSTENPLPTEMKHATTYPTSAEEENEWADLYRQMRRSRLPQLWSLIAEERSTDCQAKLIKLRDPAP